MDINKTKIDDIYFLGEKVTSLTTEELYRCIECLYNENNAYRDKYHKSQLDVIDMMDECIKIKRTVKDNWNSPIG